MTDDVKNDVHIVFSVQPWVEIIPSISASPGAVVFYEMASALDGADYPVLVRIWDNEEDAIYDDY